MIKSLTGGDGIPAEIKGSNEQFEVLGNFNILISSNADLTVNLDSDVAAWRRRLLWIRYDNPPVPDDKKIVHFDDVLLEKEGSGILNWALEGAQKVIQARGEITLSEEHKKRIEDLLLESLHKAYKALLHYVFELRSTRLIVTHNLWGGGSSPSGSTIFFMVALRYSPFGLRYSRTVTCGDMSSPSGFAIFLY